MDIKSRLDIEAVIRWEQMTGRSFLSMDFSNDEDLRRLLYCATVTCAAKPFTFEVFEQTLNNKKIVDAAIRSLSVYSAFTAQFSRKQDMVSHGVADAAQEVTIGSIAAKLIVSAGIDAHFVMHEMFIEDLPLYIEALNDRIRHEEESRRLWTFYTILPHIDAKKLKTPQKLHVFPWEAEDVARRAQEELARSEQEFYRFMRGEMIDLNAIKWHKRSIS